MAYIDNLTRNCLPELLCYLSICKVIRIGILYTGGLSTIVISIWNFLALRKELAVLQDLTSDRNEKFKFLKLLRLVMFLQNKDREHLWHCHYWVIKCKNQRKQTANNEKCDELAII